MKLMKPIAAGVAGTVSTVLVENGAPVEFGQALLLVEPEA
jgi:acetyl-CoA carboxylase biotin carboxyl carrier protein